MKGNNRQRAAFPPATSSSGERRREADTFSQGTRSVPARYLIQRRKETRSGHFLLRNAKRSRLLFFLLLDNVSTS